MVRLITHVKIRLKEPPFIENIDFRNVNFRYSSEENQS